MTLLVLGSFAGLPAGPCLVETFLLEPGLEADVLSDVGGLVSVEACLLPGTSEACFEIVVSELCVSEPSSDDSISLITGGPYLVTLLLLEKP